MRRVLRILAAIGLAISLLTADAGWGDQSALAQYGRSSSGRSSGGYSRPPSYSAPSRRPDFGGSGYGRPPVSGGDRSFSRDSSGDALRAYRQSQTPPPPPTRPPVAPNGSPYDPYVRRPPAGGYGQGWNSPPPAYGFAQPGRQFGVWDGLMLWGLLNSLTQPGRAQFFYNNQNDPGYQQWRAEANRAAATDPAVRERLDQLDRQMAQLQGQPRQPGAPPPALAQPAPSGGGGSVVFLVILLLAGVFVLLWIWRRRAASGAAPAGPSPTGSAQTRFRIGMTFPMDPSPFLLAAGSTHVTPPEGGGMASVEAVSVLNDGRTTLHRLYLPGGDKLFQLHLGADGRPDECRYFVRLDEVTPSDNTEWGAWLDPNEGMIGWPQFQSKDGKIYDRAWAPGAGRVPPRQLTETLQSPDGSATRKLQAMLYAGPTGAAAPAPQTEYMLVAAVEEGQQAWVEVHAGIDINPASLSLPAVPL